ncbi:MAG: hypothetical protein ACOC2U_02095 [bacterium]
MESNIKKIENPKKLSEALRNMKPSKTFQAKNHLGKVKWDEDAVDFQKRIRE